MWARLDDQFMLNPKVLRARKLGGEGTVSLIVGGLSYCGRSLTDGHIARASLPTLAPGLKRADALAAVLVTVGLWEIDPAGDGWRVHDWAKYNRPAERVKAQRVADAERLKRWREHQPGNAVSNAVSNAVRNAVPVPVPEETTSRSTAVGGAVAAKSAAPPPTPARPGIEFLDGQFTNLRHYLPQWEQKFPGVDIRGEIAAAEAYWSRPDVDEVLDWPQRYLETRFQNRLAEADEAAQLERQQQAARSEPPKKPKKKPAGRSAMDRILSERAAMPSAGLTRPRGA